MKIISIIAFFALTSCVSLSTRKLLIEARVDKNHPRLDEISIMMSRSSTSIGAPKIARSDNDYYYYAFDGIIESNRKCMAILEFSPNREGKAISEIYDLKKHGFLFRRNWSDWLNPDSTFTPSDGLGLGSWYSISYGGQPARGSYPFPPRTSMRYRIEKWE